MLSNIWRFLLALFDWRTLLRAAAGRPTIDVVFITNLRDEPERKRFFGRLVPRLGHANGPRMHLNGVAGRVRGIFVTAEEMMTKEGRRLAKQQFIAATAWAERKGAKVVLLAASTKRLFGRDGHELKQRFPNLLFTIGDNGTANMLHQDIIRALTASALRPVGSRILVIGPYGILGTCVTRELTLAGYDVVGYGANEHALAEIAAEFGIPVASRIQDIGRVDAVVACTHSATAKLRPADIDSLRRSGRKLLVVDVAEPANLDIDAYAACRDVVVRQDAGNAWSEGLQYVLGPLSWSKLMLNRGVVFGCFAEAMSLYHAIHHRHRAALAERDWFQVDVTNMAHAEVVLADMGFSPPAPRCFGKPVNSFDLALKGAPRQPAAQPDLADCVPACPGRS